MKYYIYFKKTKTYFKGFGKMLEILETNDKAEAYVFYDKKWAKEILLSNFDISYAEVIR